MGKTKNGGSLNRIPILDGINYDYWKAMMDAFLKSLGWNAWKNVVKGWKHPVITSQDGYTSLNPEVDWSIDEYDEAFGN